jgi:hypothetical protein
MKCNWDSSKRCQRCGYLSPVPGLLRTCPNAGLGDAVEDTLQSVGITKERVQHAARVIGVSDCGCEGRKAFLNMIGKYLGFSSPTPSGPLDG